MNNKDRFNINDNLKITRRGKKGTWTADFNVGYTHRRVSLKTTDQATAIRHAEKMSLDLAKGELKEINAKFPLDEAIQNYLAKITSDQRARKTFLKYTQVLRQFKDLVAKRSLLYLHQLKSTDFDDYRNQRAKECSQKTTYGECVILKQFLKYCKSRKLISENPFQDLDIPKPPTNKRHAPTLEQMTAILNSVSESDKIPLLTLVYTGMRSGELQRLQIQDVDFSQNWIHVVSRPGLPTKTGQSRKIPIHPILRKVLEDYKPVRKSHWFFQGKGGAKGWLNVSKLNDRLQKTLEMIGLPSGRENGFTVHSSRHFMESFGINQGVPQRAMDIWLGHVGDKSTSKVYYTLTDAESQQFMAKLPLNFESIILQKEV